MNIGGIIYLYDISQDHISGVERKNFQRIDRLCQGAALRKVVLATTNWKMLDDNVPEQRENDLTLLKSLIERRAEVRHFNGDSMSAWQIIEVFLRLAEAHRGPTFKRFAQIGQDSYQPESRPVGRVVDAVLEDGKKTDIVIPFVPLHSL